MRVIGFNFTKISIERLKDAASPTGELKISTQIDVPELKELRSDVLRTKEEILTAKFTFGVNYDPDFAKIELEGRILIALDPKIAKDVLKQWKKKKMPEDFRILLFNIILKKSSLKALDLEEELNLPLHMPMPSFKKEKK
jgi:hypothetical protein